LQEKLKVQEQQLAARSASKEDETSTQADSSIPSVPAPTDSQSHSAASNPPRPQPEDQGNLAAKACECGSCPPSSLQANQPQQQQPSLGSRNEVQRAPQIASPTTGEHRPPQHAYEAENPVLGPYYTGTPFEPMSWPDPSPTGLLSDQLRSVAIQPTSWSFGNDAFESMRTFTMNNNVSTAIDASLDLFKDNLWEPFPDTAPDKADWRNVPCVVQAQRRVQSLPSTQADMDSFLLQCCGNEIPMPSARSDAQNNGINVQRHQSTATSANGNASQLQALAEVTKAAQAAGFPDFEAAAQAYYLSTFNQNLNLSNSPKLSRNRSLPGVLVSSRDSSYQQDDRERQGPQDEIIKGAEELLAREIDSYTTSRDLNTLMSPEGINNASSEAQRQQHQDQVSHPKL
jgi:hypothetical protein